MSIKSIAASAAIVAMAALPLYSTAQTGAEYIVPSSWWLTPTQTFSVNGVGYPANTSITVNALGTSQTVTTDQFGNFTGVSFTVPYSAAGSTVNVTADGASINIGVAAYHPWMTLNTYYAQPGSSVSIDGHGFGPNERVDVSYDGHSFASVTASANGDFTANGTLANDAVSGNFVATGASTGQAASVGFSVAGTVTTSPTPTPTPTISPTPTPSVTPTPQNSTVVTVAINRNNLTNFLQALGQIANGTLAHNTAQIQLMKSDGTLAWQWSGNAQTWSQLVSYLPDSFTVSNVTLDNLPSGTYMVDVRLYDSTGTQSASFSDIASITLSH